MAKKIIIAFMLVMGFALGNQRVLAVEDETYFPYPIVPDSIQSLQSRCDYLVHHFWDFCDLKKSFSSKQKMSQAFADYISFMPYASKDSVFTSLNQFFKKLDKQPADLLFIVDCAEGQLLGDSAQFVSQELYIPFAEAVLKNKKIDKTTKARYEHQVKIYGGTQPGMKTPPLAYHNRFGQEGSLESDTADVVIIFFNDPDCDDCKLARVRLDAHVKTNILINRGVLKVVSVTVDDFSPEWQEAVKDYPILWQVAAAPEADTVYDIERFPSFYILDGEQKIVAKNFNVDQIIQVIDRL